MRKRSLSMLLALCLTFSITPAALAQEEPAAEPTPAETVGQIQPDEQVPPDSKSDGEATSSEKAAKIDEQTYSTLADAVSNASGGSTIELLQDVSLSEKIEITDKSITIDGGGRYSVTYGRTEDGTAYTGTLFQIGKEGSLILNNVTIDGENEWTNPDSSGDDTFDKYMTPVEGAPVLSTSTFVVSEGSLTLGAGAVLKDAYYLDIKKNGMYNNDLAAITVREGGHVTLDGAHIDRVAAMVVNAADSAVTLRGDTVIENGLAAGNKGGLFIIRGGSITMDGDTAIQNNQMVIRSGAVVGLYNKAVGIMNGGSVTGNKAFGGSNTAGAMIVVESGAAFTMNGGSITGNTGVLAGAIASRWTTGTFGENNGITLNGGTISGNKTQKDAWGSAEIFVRSDLTIGENMVVDGDVHVNGQTDGEIKLIHKSTIRGNLNITGTGVYATSSGNIFGDITVAENNNLNITDGIYGKDPSEWCEEGRTGVSVGNGRWGVVKVNEGVNVEDKANVTFSVSPEEAVITIRDSEEAKCAVGGGETYTLLPGSYSYTVSASGYQNQTGSFTVSGKDQTIAVTLSRESSDSSSGGSSSRSIRYTVAVKDSSNGSVRVNPTRAERGNTVTITVDPDAGYELDELIVTDSDGGEISVRDRGDGKCIFTMPCGRVTVGGTFAEEPEPLPFVDVAADAYYYDAVAGAVENGVTDGTSATTFSPDNICTRAQIVTFLWRNAGSPAPEAALNPFTDVSAGTYYYEAVLWALEQGITNGTSTTTFSPDTSVTRGQTVTFLWRNAGSPAAAETSFADVASDAYYAAAVAWAAREGITSGTSATTFSPDNACTRAQIVTFLYHELTA